MQMILPIVCGVLILAGFIALFLSRDTWRVYQIILVFFILLANAAFLYLAARTLYMHREWRGEAAKYEIAFDTEYSKFKQLTGVLDGREAEVVVDRQEKKKRELPWSLDDWKAELAEVLYGRGRVLAVGGPKVDPATGAIAAVANDSIGFPKESSVYVFELQSIRDRQRPGRYLGQYIAANVADKRIDLTPVNPEQKTNVNGPLVIYEVAPVDSHEAFAHLSADELKSLFPATVPPEVVQSYLKDGKQADLKDPPDRIWRRVRFTKEYTTKDPEAKPAAAPPPAVAPPAGADVAADEPAQPAGPIATGELKFQPGDQAVFDPTTAADLVKGLTAEYVQDNPQEGIFSQVYVRPLNNYPTAFRDVRTRFIATNLKIGETDRQLLAIGKSIQLGTLTEQLRKEEAGRLTQDLQKFTFEAETAKKLQDALIGSLKEAQQQIDSLKKSIAGQANQFARLQLQAAAAIDRQASTPTAASAR